MAEVFLPFERISEVANEPAQDVHGVTGPTILLVHRKVEVAEESVDLFRMDHAAFRKMTRGKLKPEGRIDLHGMTLSQAHPALTRFILDAHAAGKRLVLVITGKGKDRETPDPIPIRRGVLRHQVPMWLHNPPLGAVVLDIREAHQRHGGGGAYYVYLKKAR